MDVTAVFEDSVRPIAEAGLVSFVEPGSALTPDLPTPAPGRAAGHPHCPAMLALNPPDTRNIRRRRVSSSRTLTPFPRAVHEPFFQAG